MTNTQHVYQRTYPVNPDGKPYVHNDLGLYTHNHPTPPADVAERHAWLVGSGIGSLLAAAYLVRDGRMREHHHPRAARRPRRILRRRRRHRARLHRPRRP